MARKDDIKATMATWLPTGDAAAVEPMPAEPTPKRPGSSSGKGERLPGDGPPIVASEKSRTPGGMLRRTLYFTPAEWGAILAAAEGATRETGERVTAAEIVRRAVWDYLVRDLDT